MTTRSTSDGSSSSFHQKHRASSTSQDNAYLEEDLLMDSNDISTPLPRYQRSHPTTSTNNIYGDSSQLVIAIDYGTTYTGVGYATTDLSEATLIDVKIVKDWGRQMGNSPKIPSVISYSASTKAGEQQWGKSLSPNAVTMINTKLELDVLPNKSDELELILQCLDGVENLSFNHIKKAKGFPQYTAKDPEQIVTDYLHEIYQHVDKLVDEFSEAVRSRIPVTIAITVPVNWSYQAKNSTLRAVRAAGFNETNFPELQDVIMITEPEAAALYTARFFKSQRQSDVLKVDECFVLCDAGGGTVDVVSYQVKQLEPTLKLKPILKPYSSKCGSSYVDARFKQWLCEILGDRYFRPLDAKSRGKKVSRASESGPMRRVMEQFDRLKKKFPSNPHPMTIELPEPLGNINIANRVTQGELTVTSDEMRAFFNPSINGVIQLIQGQLQGIERTGRRLRNIFLIGGFAESLYLRAELEESLKKRKVQMWLPENSWSAVVRGGVIYGIERHNHQNVVFTRTCPRSYGIVLNEANTAKYSRDDRGLDRITNTVVAQSQITWLIKKNDLILPDEGKQWEKEFSFPFQDLQERKFKLPIYEYEEDDLPERYENAREELEEVAVLDCDVSGIELEDLDSDVNPVTGRRYYTVFLKCKIEVCGTQLEVKILWNEKVLCQTTIRDVDHERKVSSWD